MTIYMLSSVQISNDRLNLREPVHITALSYLHSQSPASPHLVTGTYDGHIRRYDTRVARKPVANLSDLKTTGSVNAVREGGEQSVFAFSLYPEILNQRVSELFVSDSGSSLFALDLRNGHKIYAYKSESLRRLIHFEK